MYSFVAKDKTLMVDEKTTSLIIFILHPQSDIPLLNANALSIYQNSITHDVPMSLTWFHRVPVRQRSLQLCSAGLHLFPSVHVVGMLFAYV